MSKDHYTNFALKRFQFTFTGYTRYFLNRVLYVTIAVTTRSAAYFRLFKNQ